MSVKIYNPNQTQKSTTFDLQRIYPEKPKKVYFFGTCVVDLFFPNAGIDAVKLLEYFDIEVIYQEQQSCCGQAAFSSGFLEEASEVAKKQIELLSEENLLVVVPSGSCGGMMRHHYLSLFPNDEKVKNFTDRVFELTEFLVQVCKVDLTDKGELTKIALHTSCAARREMNVHLTGRKLISQLKNVQRIDHNNESECCGFGGTFSVKMKEINGAMVKTKTQNLVNAEVDEVISADCGCLMNIQGSFDKQNINLHSKHIATFLCERIGV